METFELLDIVNEKDKVVSIATRHEVYRKRLMHRIVHVLIFNSQGEMALQLRSAQKSYCPNYWCTSVGGHVKSGETYLMAARREMVEEVGIRIPIRTFCKEIYHDVDNLDKFVYFFRAVYDGPFQINKEDIDEVKYFSILKINEMVNKGDKFHPELLFILKKSFF